MPVAPYKHDFFANFLNFQWTTGELTFSFFLEFSIVVWFISIIFAAENSYRVIGYGCHSPVPVKFCIKIWEIRFNIWFAFAYWYAVFRHACLPERISYTDSQKVSWTIIVRNWIISIRWLKLTDIISLTDYHIIRYYHLCYTEMVLSLVYVHHQLTTQIQI